MNLKRLYLMRLYIYCVCRCPVLVMKKSLHIWFMVVDTVVIWVSDMFAAVVCWVIDLTSILPVCLFFVSGGYLLEWLIFIFLSMLISMFVGVFLSMLKIKRVYTLIDQFKQHGYSGNQARYIVHHLDDQDIDMFSEHIDTYFQYRNNVEALQTIL